MKIFNKIVCLGVLVLVALLAGTKCSSLRGLEVLKRAASSHDHHVEETGHAHEEHEDSQCVVTSHDLAHEFSELSEELGLLGEDGEPCQVEEEEEHYDDEEGEEHDEEEEEHHDKEKEDGHHDAITVGSGDQLGNGTCGQTYDLVRQLLIRLNLTTPCCLGYGNHSACESDDHDKPSTGRPGTAQVYGYGFLMVVLVSLASLSGLLLLPVAQHPRLKRYYVYVYALLISLGASALFCDAILHLIPEAYGLHTHGAGDDHAHSEEEEGEELLIAWRSCVVILGIYIFLVFEFFLHTWTGHTHSTLTSTSQSPIETTELSALKANGHANGENKSLDKSGAVEGKPAEEQDSALTVPGGSGLGLLHPGTNPCNKEGCEEENCCKIFGRYLCGIKPLAWLIILGDGAHNFADGLALGSAMSQSLSLGLSTTVALVLHEIPHEVGDYFLLISTGLTWYMALFWNFISALTAILGFFIGVAIGTSSEEANSWILAATAGIFLYIALVDFLPELIHVKITGWRRRAVVLLMINIGFAISFGVLLLLTVYEDDLNSLVEV